MDLALMLVVPPVLYVVVDRYFGMKQGIIVSVVSAVLAAAYLIMISPETIDMIATELVLIMFLHIYQ